MQDGEAGPLRAGRDQQIRQRDGAVLRALGEHRLHLERPLHASLVERCPRHAAKRLSNGSIAAPTSGAVEDLEINHPAGGNLSPEQQRFDDISYLGPSLAPGQGARIRKERWHGCSAPSAAHDIGVVESQGVRVEQQLNQLPSLSQLHDLGKRRVDRIRQRLGAEDLLRGVDLGRVDLKGGLVPGGRAHALNIAIRAWRASKIHKFISLGVAFAALVALFVWMVPTAHATYDPLGSGTTKLTLEKSFLSFLKRNGITLSAKAGAKRKGASFTFAVPGGNMDPTLGKGEIENEGTLVFQNQRRKVPFRNLVVKTKNTPLIAKVGGSQLKVASSRKLSSRREGFGTFFSAKALKLTAKVATRLNKKLRPKILFTEGQPLGSLASNAQPRLVTILPQGKATLVLDPAFVTKMDKHFVSINPIFPAEHFGATFTFPIIGGSQLAPDGSAGELRTGGSFEFLQLSAGQVFQHELWLEMASRIDTSEVDIEPTPAFPGKLGRIGTYQLSSASISSNAKARTVSLSNGSLTLTAQSAQSFNEAFAEGKADFGAGELVGVLGFVAQGQ